MSSEEKEFTLKVETYNSCYEGDSTYACTIIFPLYDRGKGKETATITYESERDDNVKEQVLKDIWEYIEDPEGWTQRYIAMGKDASLKIRELEQSIQDSKTQLAWRQRQLKWDEEKLQKLEEEKRKLLVQIEPPA